MKGKNRSSRWSGGHGHGGPKTHSGSKAHSGSRSRNPSSGPSSGPRVGNQRLGGRTGRSDALPQREHARNPAPAPLKTHVPARSKSGIWLYGIHPVLAAAANPRRRTIRVIVTPEHEATIGARIAV